MSYDRSAYTKLMEVDKEDVRVPLERRQLEQRNKDPAWEAAKKDLSRSSSGLLTQEVLRQESSRMANKLAALDIDDEGEEEFEAEEVFILECVQKKKDLSKQIKEVAEKEAERVIRLQEIEVLFGGHIDSLKEQIRARTMVRDEKKEQLHGILHPPPKVPLPPGPANLRFVTSDHFGLFAAVVIIANIATMVLEMIDPAKEEEFFWLDQFYMSFYIMELVLKAWLLQCGMLFGPIHVVWWNWLDTIIVVSGCVDMYLFPMLQLFGVINGGGQGLKLLGFLRMLRLLRILKIVGMFLKADTSWSNGDQFQGFIMGVIAFNSVVMGLEIEIPHVEIAGQSGWYFIEQSLLIIFTFELACRLKHFGCVFFYHETDFAWNLLDFTIVMGGIVDQWMMPAVALVQKLMGQPPSGGGRMGEVMMLLRMARLLRILRLVRLVKSVPPLFTLIVGIAEAMQGMMWVIVLTVVILYACSLVCVKLIGKGLANGGVMPEPVEAIFPNVFDSFFVLFKAMNGDWGALEPLFVYMPFSKFILFMYTIVSTWGILSILTAVVSENMINATEGQRDVVEKEEQEREEKESEKTLTDIFDQIDQTSNGELSHKEYHAMLEDEDKKEQLKAVSGLLTDEELKKFFHYLGEPPAQSKLTGDQNDAETVLTKARFVDALKHNGREVSERSVMRLDDRIRRLETEMKAWANEALAEQVRRGELSEHIVAFLESRDKDDEHHGSDDEDDKGHDDEPASTLSNTGPTEISRDPPNGAAKTAKAVLNFHKTAKALLPAAKELPLPGGSSSSKALTGSLSTPTGSVGPGLTPTNISRAPGQPLPRAGYDGAVIRNLISAR